MFCSGVLCIGGTFKKNNKISGKTALTQFGFAWRRNKDKLIKFNSSRLPLLLTWFERNISAYCTSCSEVASFHCFRKRLWTGETVWMPLSSMLWPPVVAPPRFHFHLFVIMSLSSLLCWDVHFYFANSSLIVCVCVSLWPWLTGHCCSALQPIPLGPRLCCLFSDLDSLSLSLWVAPWYCSSPPPPAFSHAS